MRLTSETFQNVMKYHFDGVFNAANALAVAVSGGADSMALLWLLQEWCAVQDKDLHVLSVDHGLRAAAQDECAAVANYCKAFDHVQHSTLTWDAPSDIRVQEEARKARYALMAKYCEARGVTHLFLGHHAGDQAETFLFRLAKGSGLDGLCGMKPLQAMGGLTLCRPLLSVPKSDLIALCELQNIPFSDDPSNEDERFARVRLRQSMDVLEGEGLTEKRLSMTAMRMSRAQEAIEVIVKDVEGKHLIAKNTKRIEYSDKVLSSPREIIIRIVQNGIAALADGQDYAPRLERIEDLAAALQNSETFRKRTLGGVIFERDDKAETIIFTREKND